MTDLFPAVIETERLRLARLDAAVDTLKYYDVCAHDPGIEDATKYTAWEPHSHPRETADYVEGVADAWQEGASPTYAIFPREGERDAGTLVGACDVVVGWERRAGELGIWLRKPFWGRGYSGERAAALIELSFEQLDLDLVGVTLHTDNERSKRAVEKYVDRFGGQLDGRFRNHLVVGDEPCDVFRYSVSRAQWAESRPDVLTVQFYD